MSNEQFPEKQGVPDNPWQPPGDPVASPAFPTAGTASFPPQWGGYGWSAQPPQRPRRGRAIAIGAAVAVAAAVISGSLGYEIGVQHSRVAAVAQGVNAAASGPCPAGNAAPSPSEVSPAGSALLARTLPVPKGDKLFTGTAEGVMSLSDYVKDLYPNNPSEQARLVARCFQTAVHREWTTPDGTIVSVYLIQFGQAADARSYTLSTEQGDIAGVPGGTKFSVAGVADSLGLADLKLDSFGNTFTRVIGDSGDTTIIIHILIPAQANNAESSQILKAQNALLAASTS